MSKEKIGAVELAKRLGKTKQAVYDMLDKDDLNTSILRSLADIFKVPVTYFLGDDDDSNPISLSSYRRESVSQRLKKFIAYKGLSVRAFERSCNLSNGYVSGIETTIMPNKMSSIRLRYPEINSNWLLYGEGNMLVTEEQPEAVIPEEAQGQEYKLVPLYNLDVRGGFLPNTEAGKEHIAQYIAFPNAREGDICVVVSGDSMSPTFPSGSIVLLRHVEDWAEFIEYGQIYVIELRDGRRLIKEVRKAQESDKWLCKSHNATYDDVELPKKLVTRIFLVKAMYAKFVM